MFYSPTNRGNMDRFYRFRSRSISAAQAPSLASRRQGKTGHSLSPFILDLHPDASGGGRGTIEDELPASKLEGLIDMGRPNSPWQKSSRHSTVPASRRTALRLGHILPVCSLIAPCPAGAGTVSVLARLSPRTAEVGLGAESVEVLAWDRAGSSKAHGTMPAPVQEIGGGGFLDGANQLPLRGAEIAARIVHVEVLDRTPESGACPDGAKFRGIQETERDYAPGENRPHCAAGARAHGQIPSHGHLPPF